jgi:hypothetical protein
MNDRPRRLLERPPPLAGCPAGEIANSQRQMRLIAEYVHDAAESL